MRIRKYKIRNEEHEDVRQAEVVLHDTASNPDSDHSDPGINIIEEFHAAPSARSEMIDCRWRDYKRLEKKLENKKCLSGHCGFWKSIRSCEA